MKRAALALLVLATLSGRSEAQWPLAGPGSDATCAHWLTERRQDAYWALRHWTLGYMSGAAELRYFGQPLDRFGPHGIFGWLDDFCLRQPDRQFRWAVLLFLEGNILRDITRQRPER